MINQLYCVTNQTQSPQILHINICIYIHTYAYIDIYMNILLSYNVPGELLTALLVLFSLRLKTNLSGRK